MTERSMFAMLLEGPGQPLRPAEIPIPEPSRRPGAFAYELLWGERRIRSVANLTRQDGIEFLELAPQVPVRTQVTPFPLAQANEALAALRTGKIHGAAVLTM